MVRGSSLISKALPSATGCNVRGKTILFAIACIVVIGVFMKPLPFLSLLPLPAALKNNGALLMIGLVVFVAIRTRGRFMERAASRMYVPFVFYACITTMVMSLVLFDPLGILYGESTISVTLPSYAWIAMMALSLMALDYLFNAIGLKALDKVFEIFTVFVIFIGLVQVMTVISGVPLYEAINGLGLFQDIFNDRISTIGPEPSANGGIICMLALPFVVSKISHGAPVRFWAYAVLLVCLVFFVSSSQCYVAFLAFLVGCLFMYVRPGRIKRTTVAFMCFVGFAICCVVLLLSIVGGDFLKSDFIQDLRYYAFEKISDEGNASTVNRTSTLINDWFVFLQFPLFGCGDGIQGFFFNENVSNHAVTSGSQELANLMMGKSGVVGPGCFITAILSSFGIIGMILFVRALVGNVLRARKCRDSLGGYYEMALLSLSAALPMGLIGISFNGSWQFYVILAIPFLASSVLEKQELQ